MAKNNHLSGLLKHPFVLLDGAMGTMLQKSGLKLGEIPEMLCFTHPDTILSVHRQYVEAGSDIIYTNTFGANEKKLNGAPHSVEETIQKAVTLAKTAAQDKALTALSVGPIGEMMAPNGSLSFDEAYHIFRRMMTAGEQAGADLIVLETMTDLYEVKAGVLAAQENTHLPIMVSMTFEENGRTFTGCSIDAMAALLNGLGVAALGINCSLGPNEIYPLAQHLAQCTDLPLLIKANAGLPDPQTGNYDISAQDFCRAMAQYPGLGVQLMGGCCGTTPEYIAELSHILTSAQRSSRTFVRKSVVCSPTQTVYLDSVKVIGERINPTGKKRFKQALMQQDMDYILSQGIEQADAGADILDVNVGLPDIDEVAMMKQVVTQLQGVVSLPLQIDSSDPKAIEAGLRYYNGKPIVNSVNAKKEVLDTLLPLVKRYGAAVVGLTLDENGIPDTAEKRVQLAETILARAEFYGIPREDVFIDCLTLTVSAEPNSAAVTLSALREVTERLNLRTVLGVSNISFGLPSRVLINRTFLAMAMEAGLSLPIINPNNRDMAETIAAFRVLSGNDSNANAFIANYSAQEAVSTPAPTQHDISYCIMKGLKAETRQLTLSLLSSHDALDIINTQLIPALDLVGDRFEKGELFLPQLLSAAEAASAGFDVVKQAISQKGQPAAGRGKILLATVRGDIHDIGKNIVKVILENYGYDVIDLGRDVPIEKVVTTVKEQNIPLVGLSALMTTTLKSMEETISALRQSGHPCKILVGGAVLTENYARKIGADYYAKDAKQSADIAKTVLGERAVQ